MLQCATTLPFSRYGVLRATPSRSAVNPSKKTHKNYHRSYFKCSLIRKLNVTKIFPTVFINELVAKQARNSDGYVRTRGRQSSTIYRYYLPHCIRGLVKFYHLDCAMLIRLHRCPQGCQNVGKTFFKFEI